MAVVLAHFVEEVTRQNLLSGAEQTFAETLAMLNPGKFGVVLFFLISGYIIPNSLGATGDRIGRFCTTRFFRLYPLYWLVLALVIVVKAPGSVLLVLTNITMVQGYLGYADLIGSAWTLQIELTFYGLCVLLAAKHKMTSPVVSALGCIACLCLTFGLAIARFMLEKKFPVALPLAISLMFFGTVWRQATLIELIVAQRLVRWLLPAIVLSIAPISLLAYNHDYGFHETWQSYTLSYTLAILMFVVCTTRVLITWKPLVWLGAISYSIYLLHPVIADASLRFGLSAVDLPIDPLLYVGLRAVLVLPIAWATYSFIEQPAIQMGHWIVRYFGLQAVLKTGGS